MKALYVGAAAIAATVMMAVPASAAKYCNKYGECVKAPRPGYVVVAPAPVYVAPAPVYVAPAPVVVKQKKPDVVIKIK